MKHSFVWLKQLRLQQFVINFPHNKHTAQFEHLELQLGHLDSTNAENKSVNKRGSSMSCGNL